MLNYQRVCPRNSRLSVRKAAKLCTCPLWNCWGFEFQPLLEKYLTIPYLGRLCFDRGMETLHWKNTMTEKPCVYINKINIRMSLSLSISILCVCIYICNNISTVLENQFSQQWLHTTMQTMHVIHPTPHFQGRKLCRFVEIECPLVAIIYHGLEQQEVPG